MAAWPTPISPIVRQLLVERLEAGTVNSLTLVTDMTADAVRAARAGDPPPDESLRVEVSGRGVRFVVGEGIPKLHDLVITGVGTGPAMLVRLASVLDTQIEVPGMRHVQTGDDGLDRRFLVHAAEGGPGPAALHALLGVLARSGSDPSLDTGGDTLVLSSVAMMADRSRQELDSQKLQAQIHLAQQLFEALRKDSATAVLHIAAAQP